MFISFVFIVLLSACGSTEGIQRNIYIRGVDSTIGLSEVNFNNFMIQNNNLYKNQLNIFKNQITNSEIKDFFIYGKLSKYVEGFVKIDKDSSSISYIVNENTTKFNVIESRLKSSSIAYITDGNYNCFIYHEDLSDKIICFLSKSLDSFEVRTKELNGTIIVSDTIFSKQLIFNKILNKIDNIWSFQNKKNYGEAVRVYSNLEFDTNLDLFISLDNQLNHCNSKGTSTIINSKYFHNILTSLFYNPLNTQYFPSNKYKIKTSCQ